MSDLNSQQPTTLDEFREVYGIKTKGSLAVVLQLTRAFSKDELPIDPNAYKTGKQGQVAGLGGGNLASILADHGIKRLLAKEGGRTSRGSMSLMLSYADFINGLEAPVDFEAIERYWIQCVLEYFAGRPLRLSRDSSLSITSAIESVLAQARARQAENPGVHYEGTVLQHLVAAKLEYLMPEIEVHGASEADDQTGREGDFLVGDSAVHCTTAPAALLVDKCLANLSHGLRPVIITVSRRVVSARNMLEDAGIVDRVEVWDVQQFLASNVFEHGCFDAEGRANTLGELVSIYNSIVDEFEADPSLCIDLES